MQINFGRASRAEEEKKLLCASPLLFEEGFMTQRLVLMSLLVFDLSFRDPQLGAGNQPIVDSVALRMRS